jgi:carboxyl-terminal processing protease
MKRVFSVIIDYVPLHLNTYDLKKICVSFLLLIFHCVSYSQSPTSCVTIPILLQKLSEEHINPPMIDEAFHKKVLIEFIEKIDYAGLYLTVADITQLQLNPLKLSEPTNAQNCTFIKSATEVLRKRLKEADQVITTQLQKPLSFTNADSFESANKEINPLEQYSTKLEDAWVSWLKYYVLEAMEQEADIKNSKTLIAFEATARERVKAKEKNKIAHLLNYPNGLEEYVAVSLLKAIALTYDPHTEYFSNNEVKDFQAALSMQVLSFGFDLVENQIGEITIGKIVPGGSAWNSNQIHKGDALIKLVWGDGSVADVFDYDIEELSALLTANEKKTASLFVRKKDGQIVSIKLEKQRIESTENAVKSLLIKGEKSVGYISLPDFYTSWENANEKGCATDVAKEILKLKKENINGLIVDLRSNGGGSLKEAIELAGIFIDVGPLMVLQTRKDPAFVAKDMNRGTAYSGPLVILVDEFSASASEMFAAALQDYNRAIVVGTKTFGKSTSQLIFPLISKQDTLGHCKITTERVYRITGKSHQQVGIIPDVILPDLMDVYQHSEKNYRNAIPNDSIVKKVYYTSLPTLPLPEIEKRSVARITTSKWFKQLAETRLTYSKSIPLDLAGFIDYQEQLKRAFQKLDSTRISSTKNYTVQLNQFDNPMLQVDGYRKEINQELLAELKESPYVEEAYKIILDYLTLQKK